MYPLNDTVSCPLFFLSRASEKKKVEAVPMTQRGMSLLLAASVRVRVKISFDELLYDPQPFVLDGQKRKETIY